jgi:hypothetical protein
MISFLQQHSGSTTSNSGSSTTTSLVLGKILENHSIPEQVDQLLADKIGYDS